MDRVPHGSGIDYNWTIDIKHDNLIMNNAWHLLNQNGYYIDHIPFTVTVPLRSPQNFTLTWTHYRQHAYPIRVANSTATLDYIAETIGNWLDESLNS